MATPADLLQDPSLAMSDDLLHDPSLADLLQDPSLAMSADLLQDPSLVVPPPLTRGHPDWRDWAKLGKGMAERIAEHALANDVADYVHFRAVCMPWRNHTADPKPQSVLDPRFHPRRWILLPETNATGDDSHRHMLNLSHGMKIRVELPDLRSHAVAAGSGGSPGGVLVLMDERTLIVRLLNPLTGQFIDFPSVAPVLSRRRLGRLDRKFSDLCKVTGAGFAGDSALALHFGWDNKLVCARLGAESWDVISHGGLSYSAFSLNGKVYFAKKEGLMVVDAEATPPALVRAAQWPLCWTLVHMADCCGELWVIPNLVNFFEGDAYSVDFMVFRLDADAGMLIPVMDLGDLALFAGDYCGALVVSSQDFPTVIPNTIYFQHDQFNRFYMRRLSDGSTRLLLDARRGTFLRNLTSYVAWNGRKTYVAEAINH